MYRLRSCMRLSNSASTNTAYAQHAAAAQGACRMMATDPAQPSQEPHDDPAASSEPPPDPPGAFETVAAMGSGALGAVGIAAVGVFAVFQMALYVAEHSGRSMMPKPPAQQPEVMVVQPTPEPSVQAVRQQRR